ncbi:MAG: hypothetical protein LHW41_03050 [Candidatus Cloacimonetes bacterium]|nr:hypothetical protein [Candidatus Cloacimonadota bacterium]MDD3563749.1 hypothetical protein [Candidatus Cloacimonadota bacterium]
MKKLIYFILLGSLLLLLGACESGGKFNMVNETSFPIYASVHGGPIVTIPAQENREFKIDTDSQSFLTGEVSRTVAVKVKGETFSLFDDYENKDVDSTYVTIRAGKTTHAFLKPNKASIKILNERPEKISLVEIRHISPSTDYVVATLDIDILSGESFWYRVKPATLQDNYTYQVVLYLEGLEDPLVYSTTTVLGIDEQWVIHVEPPEII